MHSQGFIMSVATQQTAGDPPIDGKTVKALTLLQVKRTRDMFTGNHGLPIPLDEDA